MNINEFAEKLDKREYRKEITQDERKLAKELGFVVVFGYSDDITEFSGAISDEIGCYNGRKIYLDEDGILEECDCKYGKKAKEKAKVVEAVWGEGDYSWTYKTDIPHATFDVLEDGELYCKGIIFEKESLSTDVRG